MLFRSSAIKMREYEISHSNPRDLGRESSGFNNDKESLAGSRSSILTNSLTNTTELTRIPLPFGGSQGSAIGTLFGSPYAAGSWQDNLLEAYAGPHDFLGHPWSYDSLGFNNAPQSLFGGIISRIAGNSIANHISELMGAVDLILATPIAAASAIGISPGALAPLR